MQQEDVELRVFVRLGHAEPSTMRLPRGEKLGPLGLGTEAEWRVLAPSVLPTHGYIFYDGARLFLRSVSAQNPIHVDTEPVPEDWVAVKAPCQVRIGMAVLAITAEEAEPEASDAAATQKIVPLLAAKMVRKAPPGRLKPAAGQEGMGARPMAAEAFVPPSRVGPAGAARRVGAGARPGGMPGWERHEEGEASGAPMMPDEAPTTVLPARVAGFLAAAAGGGTPGVSPPPTPPEPVSVPNARVSVEPRPVSYVPPASLAPASPGRVAMWRAGEGPGTALRLDETLGWGKVWWRQASSAKKALVMALPPLLLVGLLALALGMRSEPQQHDAPAAERRGERR